MKKIYKVEDLCCANCAAKIEQRINKLKGVTEARVGFLTQKMTVVFEENSDIDAIMKEVVAICKKVEPDCRVIL